MPGEVHFFNSKSLDDVIDHLERVGTDGASHLVVMALNGVLTAAYLDCEARAHVITGSLRASGRKDSDFDGHDWTGTITFGGPSTGPNNPVDYAIYEMARGGSHDFFAGLPMYESSYEEAIAQFFDWL